MALHGFQCFAAFDNAVLKTLSLPCFVVYIYKRIREVIRYVSMPLLAHFRFHIP